MNIKYVDMHNVIGSLADEHSLPHISFDALVLLGQRVVRIYSLDATAKRITFDTLCHYIQMYAKTQFGIAAIKKLSSQ